MVKCGMEENGRDGVADGPVVSEGGRSPSAPSTGQGAPRTAGATPLGPLAPGQRWSAGRKREVVLRLMRGESAELLSRELGMPIVRLEQWRRKAEAALEGALKGSGHCPIGANFRRGHGVAPRRTGSCVADDIARADVDPVWRPRGGEVRRSAHPG